MSCLFGKIPFVWTIFDNEDEEEQEDFCIEEIRCCECFFDKVVFLLKSTIVKLTLQRYMDIFSIGQKS